jgi:hypothetical protein
MTQKRVPTPKQLAALKLGPEANRGRPATKRQLKSLKIGQGNYWASRATPEERSAVARTGGMARLAQMGSDGYAQMRALATPSPAQIEHITKLGNQHVASGFLASIRSEERSRRGGIACAHLRWHVARHKPNPAKCELCAKELQPHFEQSVPPASNN